MSQVASTRSVGTLSSTPSYDSMRSAAKQSEYSHPLYSASASSKDNIIITMIELEESRFSSCSSSPNSSCESLNAFPTPSNLTSRCSTTPSALSAALSSRSSYRSSRSSSCPNSRYVDDHYPLITGVAQYGNFVVDTVLDMAAAYNQYIRAINSCFNHAMSISADEIPDFLFFNQTLFNVLSQHLQAESQYLQPLLHRPVADRRVAIRRTISIYDDEVFMASFQAWANYTHNQMNMHIYSGDELQAHINSFAPRLVQHLHDQVAQLNDLVADGILLPQHFRKIWSCFEDTFSNTLDLYTDAALLVGCQDRHFTINGHKSEQNFPKLARGATTMVKKWHSRRYDGAWRYCSSDFSGKRRALSV